MQKWLGNLVICNFLFNSVRIIRCGLLNTKGPVFSEFFSAPFSHHAPIPCPPVVKLSQVISPSIAHLSIPLLWILGLYCDLQRAWRAWEFGLDRFQLTSHFKTSSVLRNYTEKHEGSWYSLHFLRTKMFFVWFWNREWLLFFLFIYSLFYSFVLFVFSSSFLFMYYLQQVDLFLCNSPLESLNLP